MRNNLTAFEAPTTSNDESQGYTVGSRWIDTQAGTEYVCKRAVRGDARWEVTVNAGLATVAGLNAALCGVANSPARAALIERFELKPFLADAIEPGTAADPSQAELDVIFAANRNFEVAGTNMTSALATQNVARGGVRLTSAGAENDQCILQPRSNPAGASRWSLGFLSDGSIVWQTSVRVADWTLVSFKAALALTNAHDLTTDADQVGIWYDGTVTPEDEGPPVVPEFITEPNFRVISSIAGTDAEVDTGIEPVNAKEYEIRIVLRPSRVADVFLNGAKVGSAGVLTTAKTLKPFLSLEALEGEAKIIDVRYQGAEFDVA